MLRNNKIATLPMNLLPKRKYIPGEIVLVDMFQFDNNGQTLWHHIAIDAFTKDFVSGYVIAITDIPSEQRADKIVKRVIHEVAHRIKDLNPPSCRTLRRWLREYTKNGYKFRSLISKEHKRGNRSKILNPLIFRIVHETAKKY